MVVQTLDRNLGHAGRMGLHIGVSNVQEYFPRQVDSVELELDHLCIVCSLDSSFWEDRPEIHDLRLSTWLESKKLGGKIPAAPAPIALIPSGQYTFRLQIIPKDAADYALSIPLREGALTQTGNSLPATALSSAPVVVFDRRKRSIGHQPERRRIGKLKGNDSSASAASH
jgi:hypothetical protein